MYWLLLRFICGRRLCWSRTSRRGNLFPARWEALFPIWGFFRRTPMWTMSWYPCNLLRLCWMSWIDCVWMLPIIRMGLFIAKSFMDRIFRSLFHLRICKIMNPCLLPYVCWMRRTWNYPISFGRVRSLKRPRSWPVSYGSWLRLRWVNWR